MNLNNIFSLNFNKNIALKSQKQSNSYQTNSLRSDDFKVVMYPKSYYLNQVSFGSKRPSANVILQRIGEENFPSYEIVRRLKDIGESNDFSLYNIHMDYYRDLLDCSTLEEAQEKYPEFINVVDAKDIDIDTLSKRSVLYAISQGKVKGIDINNLSLEMLKKYYGKLNGVNKKEEYWGLSNKALDFIFDTLNIKKINGRYANTASSQSDDFLAMRSKMQTERMQSSENRDELSQTISKIYQDPDSIYNTEEFKQKRTQASSYAQKRPETRLKRSKTMKELRQDPNSTYNSEEYKINHIQSLNTDEYKAKQSVISAKRHLDPKYRAIMDKVYEARSLAYERHPEITDMMSEVAESFPRLGEIIRKQERGIELTEQERKYNQAYFRECESRMPGYQKIISEEQHNILVEWGIKDK